MRATVILATALCVLAIGLQSTKAQTQEITVVPAGYSAPAAGSRATVITAPASSSTNISVRQTNEVIKSASKAASDSQSVLGALFLCGGGPLPETLTQTFFELGKAKEGSLVIIPSASSSADAGDFRSSLGQWEQFPWASVCVLHARDRKQVDSDVDFVKPLQQATAVWISGGDQRRLAERYLGTNVEAELQGVVKRGGIIGGTSAGSAIASRIMISGGRQQPVIANGLDLLPGAIIDQHFSQRRRYERLASAVQQHPDRVGIGIDESTGLVVSQKEARVLGAGSVYVYPRYERQSEKREPLRFDAGSAFELPEIIIDRQE